ncbi:MarR family winged helix-turn-helix transcriptional regulator [Thermoactinospora rubra]|uniref:MarR family winged helix-turn-helix transcriptional regulator n=1 Tax=Thermoactinospora rubra TaxID=1088767 RepID=UPI000A0FF602|nr:MarR family transcriptional regulator [Thermoactinospora rubra]
MPHSDVAAVRALERAAELLTDIWCRTYDDLRPIVSASQLRALEIAARRPGLTLSELAAAMGTLPSSASRLCDRLEAAGLLTRDADPRRRTVALHLSPQGTAFLKELGVRRRAELGRLLDRLSPTALHALTRALNQLARAETGDETDGTDDGDRASA